MKNFQDNWNVSFMKDFQDNWNVSYHEEAERLPGQLERFLHEGSKKPSDADMTKIKALEDQYKTALMKDFQDNWNVSYMKAQKDFQDNWNVSYMKDFQDNWNVSYMKAVKDFQDNWNTSYMK